MYVRDHRCIRLVLTIDIYTHARVEGNAGMYVHYSVMLRTVSHLIVAHFYSYSVTCGGWKAQDMSYINVFYETIIYVLPK